jgi:hypothetical protein
LPFLRLTRDRRGFENTFLLHADHPGEKPRLLYWYRTAPGIALGRPPLDEDAIRVIEEQHPDIEFDWPAILALSEVMTPEDEEPARPQKRKPAPPRREPREPRRDSRSEEPSAASEAPPEDESPGAEPIGEPRVDVEAPPSGPAGLLEELVGREIATRLRARHAEIVARIYEQNADSSLRDAWLKRSEAINPDLWVTPEAILEGVRSADGVVEQLRSELTHSPRE